MNSKPVKEVWSMKEIFWDFFGLEPSDTLSPRRWDSPLSLIHQQVILTQTSKKKRLFGLSSRNHFLHLVLFHSLLPLTSFLFIEDGYREWNRTNLFWGREKENTRNVARCFSTWSSSAEKVEEPRSPLSTDEISWRNVWPIFVCSLFVVLKI